MKRDLEDCDMCRKGADVKRCRPRGPGLAERRFLLPFDVNCGELLPGHNFIAPGLSDDGEIFARGNYEEAVGPAFQGFSLEYELVPGVPPSESDDLLRHLVGIEYTADVELPWVATDGGAIAPFEGGIRTHGSRGTWPLPETAHHLNFEVHAVPCGERWPVATATGRLHVDLEIRTADWYRY